MVKLLTYLLLLLAYETSSDEYECGGNYDVFDKNVISSLKSSGYVIEEGYLRWYSNQSAYAANPSLFYGLFVFNRSKPLKIELESTLKIEKKEEYDLFLNLNQLNDIRPHMNYDEFWYMYGSEAIIWYGCHAPAYYYSYRSYQNRRINPKHPSNAYNDSQNNNEKYRETDTYGSLGDMLNNNNINSTKHGLQMVISTPDNQTYSDIENIILNNNNLNALNLSDGNQINLDIMPYSNIAVDGPGFGKEGNSTNIYYLKYPREKDGPQRQILKGETLDGIGIMVRFGLPFANVTDDVVNSYLTTKQKVYRIYYPYPNNNSENWDRPRQEFKNPFIHNLSTGIYEQDSLEPYFTKYWYMIYKYFNNFGVNKEWRYSNTRVSQPFYNSNHKYGFNCVKYGTRCMADNRDSQYFLTWPDYSVMTNTSIFIFIGIVHKDMNKCQWENLVPYFANSGIHSKFFRSHYLDYLSTKYRYSALQFPPNVNKSGIPHNILDKFFIVAAMRPQMCAKYFDNNIQYPQLKNIPKFCFDNNDFNYSSPQKWFMVHRCYINPTTQTRPYADEMIPFISMQYETQWFQFNHA